MIIEAVIRGPLRIKKNLSSASEGRPLFVSLGFDICTLSIVVQEYVMSAEADLSRFI